MTRPPRAATRSEQTDSKPSTTSASSSWSMPVDSRVKLTRSAKPTVPVCVCRSASLGPERLDPAHGGREVSPPGVHHQVLERRLDGPDELEAGGQPRPGALPGPLERARPARTSVETCQSASRAIV